MTALAAARERAIPGSRYHGLGGARAVIYCSEEAHYSIERAAELLGIGSANVRALPIDENRRLVPEAVADAIRADRAAGHVPVAVVATAGTTLTGAVDPIGALADVCAEAGVWLHVDGAYGLPAATTPSAGPLFAGLDRADSVTCDAHKWLYLPKACGVLLVRRRDDLVQAFSHEEAYIPHERTGHMVDITLEYSRPFRALKLWLAFRAHGAQAFRDAVDENLRQARLLYDLVVAHDSLESLCGPPPLSIVPFRHVGSGGDVNAENARLVRALQDDGRVWVAPATIDGKVGLRPCFVNFRTTDDDVRALVELAVELGA
jgi:aromatic-L-amino-acid decarboxylase